MKKIYILSILLIASGSQLFCMDPITTQTQSSNFDQNFAKCSLCTGGQQEEDNPLIQVRCGDFFHKNCLNNWSENRNTLHCPVTCNTCEVVLNCSSCHQNVLHSENHQSFPNCRHIIHTNCLNNNIENCPICTPSRATLACIHNVGALNAPANNTNNNLLNLSSEFFMAFSLGFCSKIILEKRAERPNNVYVGHWIALLCSTVGSNLILDKTNPHRLDYPNLAKSAISWLAGAISGGIITPYLLNKWSNKVNQSDNR